jgi:hypothetical protein
MYFGGTRSGLVHPAHPVPFDTILPATSHEHELIRLHADES